MLLAYTKVSDLLIFIGILNEIYVSSEGENARGYTALPLLAEKKHF